MNTNDVEDRAAARATGTEVQTIGEVRLPASRVVDDVDQKRRRAVVATTDDGAS